MNTRTLTGYALVALLVLILGAFTGWYFFLNTQTQATIAEDAARGYGATTPLTGGSAGTSAQESGSSQTNASSGAPGIFSRIWNSITRRETGVSGPSTFSPQGQGGFSGGEGASQTGEGELAPKLAAKSPPRLWHVEKRPVAGLAFVKSDTGERLRYVERATGYIFEADPTSGTVTRLTNTLIPRTYEALLTESGRVIGRSINATGDTTAFTGSIATTTDNPSATSSAKALIMSDLPTNITGIATDPKTGALFYLLKDGSGVLGVRSERDGTKGSRIFGSTIAHWRPWWLADDRIILVQSAADNLPGFAYEMKDGVLSPVLRAIPGLTLLPRASGAMLYGQSSGGALTLFAQVSVNTTAVKLSLKTVADKCAWSQGKELIAYCGVPREIATQNFLDDWYRGALHTSDSLWRVDASAGSVEALYTPEPGTQLDVILPTVDSTGNYLSFINAADQSLWLLRIKN